MEKDQIKHFLKSFQTKNGESFDVPVEGSLGLLAIGDIGLLAWRLKKKENASINKRNQIISN